MLPYAEAQHKESALPEMALDEYERGAVKFDGLILPTLESGHLDQWRQ